MYFEGRAQQDFLHGGHMRKLPDGDAAKVSGPSSLETGGCHQLRWGKPAGQRGSGACVEGRGSLIQFCLLDTQVEECPIVKSVSRFGVRGPCLGKRYKYWSHQHVSSI